VGLNSQGFKANPGLTLANAFSVRRRVISCHFVRRSERDRSNDPRNCTNRREMIALIQFLPPASCLPLPTAPILFLSP
jgi:hypothetical protein